MSEWINWVGAYDQALQGFFWALGASPVVIALVLVLL